MTKFGQCLQGTRQPINGADAHTHSPPHVCLASPRLASPVCHSTITSHWHHHGHRQFTAAYLQHTHSTPAHHPHTTTALMDTNSKQTEEDLPALTLEPTTIRAERVAALRLISNSIAQQRQALNRRILSHWYFLAPAGAFVAIVAGVNYRHDHGLATLVIILAAVLMALFSLVLRFSHDYVEHAEAIGCEAGYARFIGDSGPEGDGAVVIVARWNGRVIGAVVLRNVAAAAAAAATPARWEVWAWTVELRYRGKGLGKDLVFHLSAQLNEANTVQLKTAVAVAHEKSAKSGPVQIEWAKDHASESGLLRPSCVMYG